jgi:DNA polymerase III alpha subunit (gram-positive type)
LHSQRKSARAYPLRYRERSDTLSLSRKYLVLPNYKQATVADHFEIVNDAEHRAKTDAEVCGKILEN